LDRGQRFLILTAAFATLVFVAVSLLVPGGTVIEDPQMSSTLRFTAQTIVMFVSFGVFFIQWLPPKQLKSLQAIFIATGFLSTGLLTFAHMMTCSELMDITDSDEAPVGSFFQMMSGVTMAGTMLAAAYIPNHRRVVKGEPRLLLLGFLAYTAMVAATAWLFGSSFPSLCPHDANADATRIIVEFVMIGTLLVATAKYYAIGRPAHDMTYAYLSCAALIGAYNHAAFSLHQEPNDGHSILSVLFTIASFTLVFIALFSTSVTQPYDRLRRAQKQAEKRRKEAEAATMKAQTYLDFLSHDIANMITPIMNRAEIILQSPNASDKQKDEAGKIVEQTQKVASLIANLRRLSRAERIDVNSFGALDLRVLLPELVRTRKDAHPEKRLRVVVEIPDESEVAVIGGSVAEGIIEEVFDNAIKHSEKETNRITINVTPVGVGAGRPAWNIEVVDDGSGIPDHTKSALNVTSSDPSKRYSRGVASTLTIMSLVAEQLGGRIRVEDRVVGDYTQGARVIITLPRAPSHNQGNS